MQIVGDDVDLKALLAMHMGIAQSAFTVKKQTNDAHLEFAQNLVNSDHLMVTSMFTFVQMLIKNRGFEMRNFYFILKLCVFCSSFYSSIASLSSKQRHVMEMSELVLQKHSVARYRMKLDHYFEYILCSETDYHYYENVIEMANEYQISTVLSVLQGADVVQNLEALASISFGINLVLDFTTDIYTAVKYRVF